MLLVFATVAYSRYSTTYDSRAAWIAIGIEVILVVAIGGNYGTRLPMHWTQGENLEATRGGNPRVWLVAHIDSKSQFVSTAVRTLGVALLVAAMLGLGLLEPQGPVAIAKILVGLAAIGGGILAMCVVGDRSDGAADNASGVATVLTAAALLSRETPVGVLITDAEELSLAGARHWVRHRPRYDDLNHRRIAINCDTIDDDGRWTVFHYAGFRPILGRRLGAKLERARVMHPLPGVLTDSVALRWTAWDTVTLSRGSLRTLGRIHTSRDSLANLRGTAIDTAARAIAELVEELT